MNLTAPALAPDDLRTRRAHGIMLLLVIVVGAPAIFFTEKFPIDYVWDSWYYVRAAISPYGRIFEQGVSDYELNRLLPAVIVHLGLRALGRPLDVSNAQLGFAVLDCVLLVISAVLWRRIANHFKLSVAARWLGFIALFVNFGVLKYVGYIPATDDLAAFVLGLLSLDLYLGRHTWALAIVGVLGSFVFPTVGPSVALLVALPADDEAPRGDRRGWLGTLLAASVATFFAALFLYLVIARDARSAGYGPVARVIVWAVPLSVSLSWLHVYLGFRGLLAGVDGNWLLAMVRRLRPLHLLLAVLVLAVPRVVTAALTEPNYTYMTPKVFLRFIAVLPNVRPYTMMVAHFVWFGPAIVLVVMFWRRLARVAMGTGLGLAALVAFTLIVGLSSESRQSSFGYPVIVCLLAAACDRLPFRAGFGWLFGAVSLVLSRFWVTLNSPEMGTEPRGPILDNEVAAHVFRYSFAFNGPWMPNSAYLQHLGTAIVVSFLLYWWARPALRMASNLPAAT
jgi:hypothetical protein